MRYRFFMVAILVSTFVACNSNIKPAEKGDSIANSKSVDSIENVAVQKSNLAIANAETILGRKEVPVLCYHHIKELTGRESANMKTYSVTPEGFAAQMKLLSENGYNTILPDQLYDYLAYGKALPENPIMLTFDDTNLEQYTIGAAEMKKYGFKGVFFIMTISMNKPRYMSKEQIKELSDDGHVIACHTWDHHMVTKYTGDDGATQLEKPRKKLEEITGKPIEYFAYPFGLWNTAAITEIKKRDYKLAFILSTKRDSVDPLYTVRRIIVPSQWSTATFQKSINASFHQ